MLANQDLITLKKIRIQAHEQTAGGPGSRDEVAPVVARAATRTKERTGHGVHFSFLKADNSTLKIRQQGLDTATLGRVVQTVNIPT